MVRRRAPTPTSDPGDSGADRSTKVADAVDWIADHGAAPRLTLGGASTANSLVLSHPAGLDLPLLAAGPEFSFVPSVDSSTAVIATIDSLGPIDIKDPDGAALNTTRKLTGGRLHKAKLVSASEARITAGMDLSLGSTATNIAIFARQLSSGTAGGGLTLNTNTAVVLNTTLTNGISGATLDTGTGIIELPAGTYRMRGWQMFSDCDLARVRLMDTTMTTERSGTAGSPVYVSTSLVSLPAPVGGLFTINATTQFLLVARASKTKATSAMGLAMSQAGVLETYAMCELEKVA